MKYFLKLKDFFTNWKSPIADLQASSEIPIKEDQNIKSPKHQPSISIPHTQTHAQIHIKTCWQKAQDKYTLEDSLGI